MYNPIKIGDFLRRKKVPINLNPEEEYTLLTVKLHHKGVVQREKKKGSLIGSNMYRVSSGDFILSGIDARNGAFGIVPKELDGAIVTNDFWYFSIDESKVKRDFFFWLTTTPLFLDACQKSSKGETQRIRLQKELFYDFKFHFPSVEKQDDFLLSFQKTEKSITGLSDEANYQTDLLTKLRQSILQDAIEGKLTIEWRNKNPVIKGNPEFDATALLANIKSGKQKLIAEGEIKKEKTFPQIKSEEVSFEAPKGWAWSRVIELTKQYVDCPHDTPEYIDSGFPCIRAPDVTESGVLLENTRYVSEKEYANRINRLSPKKNDIIYIREGGRLGIAGLLKTDEAVCLGQRVMLLRCFTEISSQYLTYYFNAPKTFNAIVGKTLGSASPHVNVRDIVSYCIPVPPLAEQKAIVLRVKQLLEKVEELETGVQERQFQSEHLLQVVLREAFDGNGND